ncbi:MAG: PD40 domain-containing protein [Candidatus Eisenbacteria bacterium]|nr:PD40 domain-containing protein [Candidatus Eisenbacteria bacterium]
MDSIAACPAGDSLNINDTAQHHPSKLRIEVWYDDANCQPKVGVPPESLCVTWSTATGNAKINDEGLQIFADDSTDACGHTRFTIPSLSGCGKLSVAVKVSGRSQGSKNVVVRTVDVNANGRVDNPDLFQTTCDVNYDGAVMDNDRILALQHEPDWHRNALFGTLVRRTNLCETCLAESTGTIGESEVFWSPDGKRIAFTIHTGPFDPVYKAACRVFLVRSDPAQGNALKQFTFNDTIAIHDYDPSWSPLGTAIVYDRDDRRLILKGLPESGDTTEVLVSASGDLNNSGDATPAISPDGQWVAFSRRESTGPRHIYKVPITGGTATQLTNEVDGVNFYPQWSHDGVWITFDRQPGPSTNPHHVYKVMSDGSSLQAVYDAPAGKDAATPAYSPDAAILLFGQGTHDTGTNPPRDVTAHTLDPLQSTLRPIANYNDTTFAVNGPDAVLSPRLSPDGTRLALRSKQLWAARRNMSLPPRILQVGTQGVADSTATVSINVKVGLQSTITVTASDPESDALTYAAYFLQSGMSFDPATATLTWTPPGPVGSINYVRFEVTTASGGTDAIIAILTTVSALGPSAARPSGVSEVRILGPNPTRGVFAVATPLVSGSGARLSIFDPAGRVVARVRGASGSVLTWDGRVAIGVVAPPGEYLYRIEVGPLRKDGKIVVAR